MGVAASDGLGYHPRRGQALPDAGGDPHRRRVNARSSRSQRCGRQDRPADLCWSSALPGCHHHRPGDPVDITIWLDRASPVLHRVSRPLLVRKSRAADEAPAATEVCRAKDRRHRAVLRLGHPVRSQGTGGPLPGCSCRVLRRRGRGDPGRAAPARCDRRHLAPGVGGRAGAGTRAPPGDAEDRVRRGNRSVRSR